MGKIEALQKKIDQVADKVRHLRYMFIVLICAIIGVVFGISQGKVIDNLIVSTFLIAGTLATIAVGILIRSEEKQRNKLIDELQKTVKDQV